MKNLLARSGAIALLSLVLPAMASAEMGLAEEGTVGGAKILIRHAPGMEAWQGGLGGYGLAHWITMIFIWILLASASAALWHWMLHHGNESSKKKRK